MAMIFCYECGAQISDQASACPKCGAPAKGPRPQTSAAPVAPSGKNKTTAGILALLLGGFGVHKFYLGKVGMGLLYLFFCWTCIPAIAAVIEGILYLGSTDEAFERKYAH
jgi:TM2 domain-containing membrane protein YozV